MFCFQFRALQALRSNVRSGDFPFQYYLVHKLILLPPFRIKKSTVCCICLTLKCRTTFTFSATVLELTIQEKWCVLYLTPTLLTVFLLLQINKNTLND